ncbi:MAG: hypothetical protein IJW06_04495 [Clostridia bacterium]|nr:hypothetical protein [Clostridia bacterium]
MKKNYKKLIFYIFSGVTVFLFVTLLVVTCILFFITPKKDYSIVEKRKLTEFPKFSLSSLADGTYTDNITKYVSDNFVFRENLVEFSSDLEDKRGIRVDGVKLYNNDLDIGETLEKSIDAPLKKVKKMRIGQETPLLGEEVKETIDFMKDLQNIDIYEGLSEEEIIGQQAGPLFLVGKTALEIFYGNSNISADYVNIINNYRLAISSDVNVYDMVVPTHFEFGLPEKYKGEVGKPQKPFIDEIYANLDPSVIKVDAYSKIKKAYDRNEYVYFRSDHHWTALGAYRAYEAFAKSAGFTPTPLKDFENKRIEEFLGTFYSSTYDKNLKESPDFVSFYAPKNKYTVTNYRENGTDTYAGTLVYNTVSNISHGYLVFMGGDIPLSVIETDASTGRSLLVFKESYGNAFVPFLVGNFDKIYVADIRTFPFNAINFVSENNITDVLFLNNIITSCSPPRIKNYLDLMQK